jgi:hypothetical protein
MAQQRCIGAIDLNDPPDTTMGGRKLEKGYGSRLRINARVRRNMPPRPRLFETFSGEKL